jgi:hypothetical protein
MPRRIANRSAWICGIALAWLAGCGAGEPDAQVAVERFQQSLVIQFEGKAFPIPIDALDVWLTRNSSRPEIFEIHGNGVAIVGAFPPGLRVGYDENWHALVGKSVPVSARGGNPRYQKPSVLNVPRLGQFRVIGGHIVVETVEPGWGGQTPLTGRIQLRVRAARGESVLNGAFAVKAMTWG